MRIILHSAADELHLAAQTGALLELRHNGRNPIRATGELFRLRLRSGETVGAADFNRIRYDGACFHYEECRAIPGLEVSIRVTAAENGAFRFRMERVKLPEGKTLTSYELPLFHLPDDFTVLDPLSEGRLLPPGERYATNRPYENDDQLGHYPGYCQAQLAAGFDAVGGVRLFARDARCRPKRIKVVGNTGGGFVIETFDAARGIYHGDFELELSAFDGDWMEAARPYRDWVFSAGILPERPEDPPWLDSSPVIVTYVVCGEGEISAKPNCFVPYRNALAPLLSIARATESRIMALPMRWDARGPWTPPLHWPPVGGAESFAELVRDLHDAGHLIGLYGSGVSWTTHVYPTNREIGPGPDGLMTENPDGSVKTYDFKPFRRATKLCLSQPESRKILIAETLRIAASGIDFYQMFDQDLGGAVPKCYSETHGHAPGPGPHETAAGREFHAELKRALREHGFATVIGTEDGAAEPFIDDMRFNDLRIWPVNPVPLHQYLYHEVAADFSGNQCMGLHFDCPGSPENLLYRTALGFIAGALLTVPMRKNGEADWAAGAPWKMPEPPTEKLLTLVRNLNHVRKRHLEFLQHGRMIPTENLETPPRHNLKLARGGEISVPLILATSWESRSGARATVLANWSEIEQHIRFNGSEIAVPALDAVVAIQSEARSENSSSSWAVSGSDSVSGAGFRSSVPISARKR